MEPQRDASGCLAGPTNFLRNLLCKLRDIILGTRRNANATEQPRENTTSNGLSPEHLCNSRRITRLHGTNTRFGNQTTISQVKNDKKSSSVGDSKEELIEASIKLIPEKSRVDVEPMHHFSDDEEDVCPTCLEEYDHENPKIITKCSHHFHLGCIYEWKERSDRCPVCYRVMVFEETS